MTDIKTTPLDVDHDAITTAELSPMEAAVEGIVRGGPVTGTTTVHMAREIVQEVRDAILREQVEALRLARNTLGDVALYLGHRSEMYAALHCSEEVQYPPLMERVKEAILALEHGGTE